ncbi:MAG: 7-carboxy-7-deazaguanine synthase QueE [Kiritimatiellae bacterium]|nr:7-carboxy-7-deazaguanine synthase QueE [Kiritimatiellia bacterium]
MSYKLVEIFESLQGEGRNTGRPCVFVRFAGCNLACPWCDTDVRERFSMTLEELLAEIASYKAKTVVLTGGEPTLIEGAPELIAALKAAGYFIAVETNATVDAPWLQFVDYVACSPKAEFPDKIELKKANEVRVVASDDRAVEFCQRVKEIIEADDYYVSPCDHDGEIDFATAKSVLSKLDGWSLSVQLHKILGFR